MKANEAPEKLYITNDEKRFGDKCHSASTEKYIDDDIEYLRTEVFIEKACDAYCKVCKMPNCRRTECNWISDFKEHLKTI